MLGAWDVSSVGRRIANSAALAHALMARRPRPPLITPAARPRARRAPKGKAQSPQNITTFVVLFGLEVKYAPPPTLERLPWDLEAILAVLPMQTAKQEHIAHETRSARWRTGTRE